MLVVLAVGPLLRWRRDSVRRVKPQVVAVLGRWSRVAAIVAH